LHPEFFVLKLISTSARREVTRKQNKKTPERKDIIMQNKYDDQILDNLAELSDTEIEGFRLLGTFCYNSQAVFPMYFVMRVNKQPTETGYWKKQPTMTGVKGQWDTDNGKYKSHPYFLFHCSLKEL